MFHFAEPDEAGSGVTILTPGLTRSSHPVMCSGLPFLTTMTTTESATMPLSGPRPNQLATLPACCSLPMSEPVENAT